MSVQFSIGQLKVNSRFKFLSVIRCNIHAKYGEHTRVEIAGTVKGNETEKALLNVSEDKLEIIGQDDDGIERILFRGSIECVEQKQEGSYAILTIQALSDTWKTDIERKNRSFQGLSITYKDVAEKVLQGSGVAMSWNLPNKSLDYPLIQYRETDFCFLKRILSHLGGGITVADTEGKTSISAGLKKGSHVGRVELANKPYSTVFSKNKRVLGYKIEDMGFVRVGDVLSIQGRAYYVMETETSFLNSVMSCTCIVFPEQCFETKRVPADTLKGTILTGTVLKTEQEKVKLHLDIDKEQAMDSAYGFPWEPITGNLLYCMPEEGSQVALYFGEGEEKSAVAIYNIRENDGECEGTAYCNDRYFVTKHEKKMYLNPSEIGFVNINKQNAEISLRDMGGLEVKSSHEISIMAEGRIELKGKKINITAPKEATLVKKDIMAPTVINLCNAFDAIGNIGDFTSIPTDLRKKRNKGTSGQPLERYSLAGAVGAVLSNIPADETESLLMTTVAGSMPITSGNVR